MPRSRQLLPGVWLERAPRWNALVFGTERPTLSSAPVGGGEVHARRVVNLSVSGDEAHAQCDDPATAFEQLAAGQDWRGKAVGLMTGVAADHLGVAQAGPPNAAWAVLATVGVRNTHRAGAPASGPCAQRDVHGPGTINVIAATPQGLTPAARAEAIALVAETKAGLLADLGIRVEGAGQIATGTGTDAVAITSADGADTPYTGYYTASGQALIAAVREAMRASLAGGETCGFASL